MNAVLRSLSIVVGLPTLIAAIYFSLIASDVFVSEARFAIRSATNGGGGGLASLLTSPLVSSGGQDAVVVTDHAKSQDMLDKVLERMDLRAHYASADIDLLSRLDAEATREQMLDYFLDKVHLVRDSNSDVVTLEVQAFSPEVARSIASTVIELSEDLVNRMSNRIEEDALSSARREIELARAKVLDTSVKISRFRDDNDSLNPTEESSALLGLVTGLETRLIETRSLLGEKLAYMRESAPEVVTLRNRINALSRQLALEKGRLLGDAGADGVPRLGDLIEGYRPLELEQNLAQQQYASSLISLEQARLEAQRKKLYLVTFVPPNLPDSSTQPRPLIGTLTVAVFALLAYLIGGLMWSALRDHIGR